MFTFNQLSFLFIWLFSFLSNELVLGAFNSKVSCESGYKSCSMVDACYAPQQECNFIDDCGDGTDEAECPSFCDFELGNCGWKNMGKLKWKRQNSLEVDVDSKVRPSTDYTLNSREGHTLIAEANFETDIWSMPAEIESPTFSASGPMCTLKFFYYQTFQTTVYSGLRVYTNEFKGSKNYQTKIWSVVSDQGPGWHEAAIPIGQINNPFNVSIEAFFGYNRFAKHQFIAIDDLSFVDCSQSSDKPIQQCSENEWECSLENCIPLYQLCDGVSECFDGSDEHKCTQSTGSCDFDSKTKTTCDWTEQASGYRWTHSEFLMESFSSSGYMILIPEKVGDVISSSLAGPLFQPSKGQCHITINYFIGQYSENAKLELGIVKSNHEAIKKATFVSKPNNNWQRSHIVLDSDTPFYVTLNGTATYSSPILIKYIKVTPNCVSGAPLTIDAYPGYAKATIRPIIPSTTTLKPSSTSQDTKAAAPEAPSYPSIYYPKSESSPKDSERVAEAYTDVRDEKTFQRGIIGSGLAFLVCAIVLTGYYVTKLRYSGQTTTWKSQNISNPMYSVSMSSLEAKEVEKNSQIDINVAVH